MIMCASALDWVVKYPSQTFAIPTRRRRQALVAQDAGDAGTEGLNEAHVAVLLQAHTAFDHDEIIDSGTCILDTRGVLSGPNVVRL